MNQSDATALRVGRLAVAGNGFMVAGDARRDIADEAVRVFSAVSDVMRELGGWLLDDGVPGASSLGFAQLMDQRHRGLLPWDSVCPSKGEPAGPRSRQEMKLPHVSLVHQGSPCWCLQGHVYSVDLFNPGNELLLAATGAKRFWELAPWPARFAAAPGPSPAADFGPFAKLIARVAVALDSDYGFGGRGLREAVLRMGAGTTLTDSDGRRIATLDEMSYPFMLVRRGQCPAGLVERLRSGVFEFLGGVKRVRPSFIAEFATGDYVLMGLSVAPEGYPMGDPDLGEAVGRALGRTPVLSVVM